MVALDARGVSIEGRYRTILCSSLFYFRIPEGLWADRMKKIRAAGYNTIDVYFPWNFHELERDTWDLETGMRDVRTFLGLAARNGLWVVARPGPYICSEWDGGALPAYLTADGLPIRQNHAGYLDRVREWYRRILPIIAEHQLGRGGTVILVQIENELDFYDCDDPAGYIAALRDMARAEGVTVPLFACAGQGDLGAAWGSVRDVAPSLNLYLDSRLPGMEAGLRPYVDHLGSLGFPLMVTETGRDVLLLRRLLASGAKLLGPYNQVGGFDFGFTNGLNNWGTPLSFQTSHYSFGSLVDPFGVVREEVWEHRALAGLIETLGCVLAPALPATEGGVETVVDGRTATVPVLALGSDGRAGLALCVSNTTDRTQSVRFRRDAEWLPLAGPLSLEPGVSCFVFFDLLLEPMGLPGRLVFSTAEPFDLSRGARSTLVLQAPGEAEVHYDPGTGPVVIGFPGPGGRATAVRTSAGEVLVRCVPRRDVMAAAAPVAARRRPVRWKARATSHNELFPRLVEARPGQALAMEAWGRLRGYALYRAAIPDSDLAAAAGVLLHGAADVVSAYLDGRYLGTRVPGGGEAWFEVPARRTRVSLHVLEVRCEIWGHSNFDDARLPALRMGSLRGIAGATLVTRVEALPLWSMQTGRASAAQPYLSSPGGRLTARVPARYTSAREITPAAGTGRWLLRLENAECPTVVSVDGRSVGWVDRHHPILSLDGMLSAGRTSRITLEPQKWYAGESAGTATLLQGTELGGWSMAGMDESGMAGAAARATDDLDPVELPLSLPPGSLMWLRGRLQGGSPEACRSLTLAGRNLKASVLFNGRLVGRILLECPGRPRMAGGRDDVAYLPGCWRRKDADELVVLLEGVGSAPGRLQSATLAAVGSPG